MTSRPVRRARRRVVRIVFIVFLTFSRDTAILLWLNYMHYPEKLQGERLTGAAGNLP